MNAVLPMLATPTPTPGVPPAGPEWVHEVKWDGVRAMAHTDGGTLRLTNRTGVEITVAYPEVVKDGQGLPDGLTIDGEIIALDANGLPNLQAIAYRMHQRDPAKAARLALERPATFVAFDVVRVGGVAVNRQPLTKRRELLEALDLNRPAWQLSAVFDDGEALAAFTREKGLEGVMSKRRDSTYQPGARSFDWLKVPHRTELVAVIGGWVPEKENDQRLGSVWVGHPADEATFDANPVLYPLARAGSGLSHAERDTLLAVLRQTGRASSPFDPVPDHPEVRRTHWVEPMLCVQLRYLSVAPSGALRQPVLRFLRPDVTPTEAPTAALF